MISPLIIMIVLWLSLITYAVLGGADFGGGVWALLAQGPDAPKQRQLVEHAVGPVWEANNVWLIFLVVGLYIAFPPAAYTIAVALFIPFTLIVLGVVLRGASFAFSTHIGRAVRVRAAWSVAFSAASIITPFLLGCVAAAIASGQIRYIDGNVQADRWAPWLTPFALSVGAVALAMCATLAAVFLTVEAQFDQDVVMMGAFR
ncbi:MAG: cytochrome d ubiquinol oxidase subunit II, partial [Ktedonobacterales bacterium]|nr:cytochrome d ubiquinol oxidase subunit II [Ktedonobacterales bacterium]